MHHPTIQETIDGLGWYYNYLEGRDVSKPTKAHIMAWVSYAAEILESFKNHPDVTKEYE